MKVLVTGATGFIGRPLCLRLLGAGHTVRALSRGPDRARGVLPTDVEIVGGSSRSGDGLVAAVDGTDGVIHLAGESIASGRWSRDTKARIRSSRVDLTRQLVSAIGDAAHPPSILVSGSAVGLYGSRGDEFLDEDSAAGEGFLADVARDWEAAAQAAEGQGLRVVRCRTGVVLGPDGGALPKMALPFRVGLGGPVGTGRQYVPWIHQDDMVESLLRCLEDPELSGPVLAVAPQQATNRDLCEAIGAALGRPSWLPAPSLALRVALGEAADLVLDSLRCTPTRLQERGFQFRFGSLEPALADLLQPRGATFARIQPADLPDHPYVARRKPRHRLTAADLVAAPVDEVFAFFSQPRNLGALSPAGLALSILGEVPAPMTVGSTMRYGFSLGPVPLRWQAEVIRWEDQRGFTDIQHGGPYRSWWHEHDFEAVPGGTRVQDRVLFAAPLGPIGDLAGALAIEQTLARIFDFRRRALRWRFGEPATSVRTAA